MVHGAVPLVVAGAQLQYECGEGPLPPAVEVPRRARFPEVGTGDGWRWKDNARPILETIATYGHW